MIRCNINKLRKIKKIIETRFNKIRE